MAIHDYEMDGDHTFHYIRYNKADGKQTLGKQTAIGPSQAHRRLILWNSQTDNWLYAPISKDQYERLKEG